MTRFSLAFMVVFAGTGAILGEDSPYQFQKLLDGENINPPQANAFISGDLNVLTVVRRPDTVGDLFFMRQRTPDQNYRFVYGMATGQPVQCHAGLSFFPKPNDLGWWDAWTLKYFRKKNADPNEDLSVVYFHHGYILSEFEPGDDTLYFHFGGVWRVIPKQEAAPGCLDLVVLPSNAKVHVKGRAIGQGSHFIPNLKPTVTEVEVSASGYLSRKIYTTIKPTRTTFDTIRLVRIPDTTQFVGECKSLDTLLKKDGRDPQDYDSRLSILDSVLRRLHTEMEGLKAQITKSYETELDLKRDPSLEEVAKRSRNSKQLESALAMILKPLKERIACNQQARDSLQRIRDELACARDSVEFSGDQLELTSPDTVFNTCIFRMSQLDYPFRFTYEGELRFKSLIEAEKARARQRAMRLRLIYRKITYPSKSGGHPFFADLKDFRVMLDDMEIPQKQISLKMDALADSSTFLADRKSCGVDTFEPPPPPPPCHWCPWAIGVGLTAVGGIGWAIYENWPTPPKPGKETEFPVDITFTEGE